MLVNEIISQKKSFCEYIITVAYTKKAMIIFIIAFYNYPSLLYIYILNIYIYSI